MDKKIHIATIGAPFGVRGCFRLKTHTEDPKDALAYGPLTDGKGKIYAFTLIRVENDNTIVVSEAATPDRTAAEALRGIKLYGDADKLPDLEDEDAFYANDLVNMVVKDNDGITLGAVSSVENYGASDILVIKMSDGTLSQIAFIEDSVIDINLDEHFIVIVKEHLL